MIASTLGQLSRRQVASIHLASERRSSRKLRRQEGIREMGLLNPISLTADRQALLSQAASSMAALCS
jgi:hypothetical protein